MVTVEGPRLATADDFPGIHDLVDRAFHKERGGMAARIPTCYDEQFPEHHAVICEEGAVVAHAAAVPETLVVGDGDLACRGIGGVSTEPDCRGKGYMSDLMEFWLDRADAALFELGGDRQRYGRFGWEDGGRELRYRITERSLSAAETAAETAAEGRAYTAGTDLETLRGVHEAEPLRVKRTRRTSERLFGKRGVETLVVDADDPSYLCVDRERREANVVEFGGTEAGVRALLQTVFAQFDIDSLTVRTPPTHRLNPLFHEVSSVWTTAPLRKVNVRDLGAVLAAFQPQMTARLSRHDVEPETVSLAIEGEEGVELQYEGALSISQTDDPDITLGRRKLTTVLFGEPSQGATVRRRSPLLEAACPLTYFVWPSERV
ncbi:MULTISPECIES: GNAT family N-acetyltransferase [unclassified Haladaptatus]|uniref:GNAT family N-acetyltransferase n=1 Tax=unclassified Haladaptatus TaxID=2622732 RepID=UPI0023E7713D|nr:MULTISPECIES: GNAT family N-acetyltransferase [unclassified Haladaptatus]